jgi:putative nucleotidyltransferase-like protein
MNIPTLYPALQAILHGLAVPCEAFHAHEWEKIFDEAIRHGFASQLFQQLTAPDSRAGVPPILWNRLRREAIGIAARNVLLEQELATLLRRCRESCISCMPLRGMALAAALNRDHATRPTGDIDLLVRREQMTDVTDMLKALGYHEVDRRSGFALAYSYTLEFATLRHGGILVEPHWTLAYPPCTDTIEMDRVWERCIPGTVAGVETMLLSQEDTIINLCWHLRHKGSHAPLLWWYEIHQLIRHGVHTFDWSQFIRTAGVGPHTALLADVLCTLVREFRSPVPDWAITELNESASIPTHHSTRLFTGLLAVDGIESLAQFFAIKGLRAKARYAWALLIPSREFMIQRYEVGTSRQLYFRYGMRGLTLAWETAKGLLNAVLPVRRHSIPKLP